MVVFTKACEQCQKGKRDCEVDVVGVACTGCKTRKYKCNHTNKIDLKTMMVTRTAEGLELEVPPKEGHSQSPGSKKASKVEYPNYTQTQLEDTGSFIICMHVNFFWHMKIFITACKSI